MKKVIDLKIGEATFKLTSPDAKMSQEFLDWANENMPDPVEEVVKCAEKLPESYREKFLDRNLDKAFERKRLRGGVNDPEFHKFCDTPEALYTLFWILLRPCQPHMTKDDVVNLLSNDVTAEDVERVKEALDSLQRSAQKVPISEDDAERRYFRRKGNASKGAKRRTDKMDTV